jgi:hypothetical protein
MARLTSKSVCCFLTCSRPAFWWGPEHATPRDYLEACTVHAKKWGWKRAHRIEASGLVCETPEDIG